MSRTPSIFAGRDLVMRCTPLDEVDDYLRLGFVPTSILAGTHHAVWSVMMAWGFCQCRPMPRLRRPA